MKKILYTILIGLALAGCREEAKEASQMPITEFFYENLEEGDLLVDVRTPGEYGEGHLEGAVNIDWMAGDFIRKWDTIDKNRKVYVYCKLGGRSAEAAHLLDSLGYNVVDLTGGWDAYKAQ
ncbi:MAG: rhodanese-like domain-containing protein [Flavobacteriaceae bacterium]|nr:MAG: rhodanese-like domain-containing protein [Flavobacteriaceae bacterium]